MGRIIDNLIAVRIIYLLVTPFEKTKAYALGIIDENGNPKLRIKDMSAEQKENYTMLHRLVFRMKKMLATVPGGKTRIATIAAAYMLVRECLETTKSSQNLEEEFTSLVEKMDRNSITLIEEEVLVKQVLAQEDVPTNSTSGASVNEPVVKKKKPSVVKRNELKEDEDVATDRLST